MSAKVTDPAEAGKPLASSASSGRFTGIGIALQRSAVRNVGRDTQRAPAELFDLARRRFNLFRAARSRDYVGACLGEAVRDCASNTGSAADYDGHFAVKLKWRVGHIREKYWLKVRPLLDCADTV